VAVNRNQKSVANEKISKQAAAISGPVERASANKFRFIIYYRKTARPIQSDGWLYKTDLYIFRVNILALCNRFQSAIIGA